MKPREGNGPFPSAVTGHEEHKQVFSDAFREGIEDWNAVRRNRFRNDGKLASPMAGRHRLRPLVSRIRGVMAVITLTSWLVVSSQLNCLARSTPFKIIDSRRPGSLRIETRP